MKKNTEALEKFSIKCEGVDWSDVKEGIGYLRKNGIKVRKNKDEPAWFQNEYCLAFSYNQRFERMEKRCLVEHLTLPRDWHKLVAYIDEYRKDNKEASKPKPLFTNSFGVNFFAGETVYWWCSSNSRVIKGNIDKIETYEETGGFVHVSQIYKTELQAKEDRVRYHLHDMSDSSISDLCSNDEKFKLCCDLTETTILGGRESYMALSHSKDWKKDVEIIKTMANNGGGILEIINVLNRIR